MDQHRSQFEDHGVATAPATKTLGITWIVAGACFTFQYTNLSPPTLTKRIVLSRMASLFDPRGHLAPFTIQAKLIFQELCITGLGWDDELPHRNQERPGKGGLESSSLSLLCEYGDASKEDSAEMWPSVCMCSPMLL